MSVECRGGIKLDMIAGHNEITMPTLECIRTVKLMESNSL